ncbi:MAG: hypothetical protein ACKO2L_19155, partial [Planctomycetaceae bacterium]
MRRSLFQSTVIIVLFSAHHAVNASAVLPSADVFANGQSGSGGQGTTDDGKPDTGGGGPGGVNGGGGPAAGGGNGAGPSSPEQLAEIRRQAFESMKTLGYDADQLLQKKGYTQGISGPSNSGNRANAAQAPVIGLFRRLANSPLVDSIVATAKLTGSKAVVVRLVQDALRMVLGAEVGVIEAESAQTFLTDDTQYKDLISLLEALQADKQSAATKKEAQAQQEAAQAKGEQAEKKIEEIQKR